jgi:adenine-specific DNA methylase
MATRREFIAALKGPTPEERVRLIEELERSGLSAKHREEIRARLDENLPSAVAHLQGSNIAPVDLAQAAIGPGMAIYTSYSKVLDASGQPLTVREALALINQTPTRDGRSHGLSRQASSQENLGSPKPFPRLRTLVCKA